MASVSVERRSTAWPHTFDVKISEASGSTSHEVTLDKETYTALATEGVTPEAVVEACFEFLLDHEPKESILARFDVTAIGRYFPNYQSGVRARLARRG